MRKQSWEHEYFKKALITQKRDILTKFWPKKLVSFVFKTSFKNFSKILSAHIANDNSEYLKKHLFDPNWGIFPELEPKSFFVKFTECGLKHPRHCLGIIYKSHTYCFQWGAEALSLVHCCRITVTVTL